MNQHNTLTVNNFGVNELSFNEMALVDGGMSPYELGNALGHVIIIAATIAAFL